MFIEFETNIGVLVKKPEYIPKSNGCGSDNVNFDFNKVGMGEFNKCCDHHDFCYTECDNTKVNCDNVFYSCLNNQCDQWAREYNWNYFKKFGLI